MAPNFAIALLRRSRGLKLQGLAIGDGWVDPVHQNLAFPKYAYGTGLVGADLRDALRVQAERCAATIRARRYVEAFENDCYYHLLDPIVAAAGRRTTSEGSTAAGSTAWPTTSGRTSAGLTCGGPRDPAVGTGVGGSKRWD